MGLLSKIKELGEIHGIDFVGVAGITRVQNEIKETGGLLTVDYPRAISIGIILQNDIVNLLHDRNSYENILQYQTHAYEVINNRLNLFSSIVGSVLQQNGFKAMPILAADRIDSDRVCASVSHKMIARLAGFGWIGKSCLLVHPYCGPRVRWTTILTDAPLEENQEIMENRCASCDVCVKACPAQAITGRNYVEHEPREMRLDVKKCEEYLNQQKKTVKLPVCGMCLNACPFGKKQYPKINGEPRAYQ